MPADIVETSEKGTPISAPLDADPRNAASVRTPFQSVGNRLKFLEAFYDLVTGGLAGALTGLFQPAMALTIEMLHGDVTFDSNDDWNLAIGPNAKFNPNGRINTHCFDGNGSYGRPNRRVQYITPAVNTSIDPILYDTIKVSPSADLLDITIAPSLTPTRGDFVRVILTSTLWDCNVRAPGGGLIKKLNYAPGAGRISWVECIYDGTNWFCGPNGIGV
jgi:hypothetical protein